MLKHNLGSTTEKRKEKELARARLRCLRLHLTAAPLPLDRRSLASFPICLLFPSSRRDQLSSGSRGALAEPRESPWPPTGLREPPACSPGLSRLPSPGTSAGAFLPPLPFVLPVCCPQRGSHRRRSRPQTLPAASAPPGTGVEIKNQTPRRPQSGHAIPCHPIQSYPIPSHPIPAGLHRSGGGSRGW